MTLRKLKKRDDGSFSCPACGNPLRFKDGEAVAVVSGQLDMDNYKPRYICDDCKVYYRAVLTTDYYDVFPLNQDKDTETKPEPQTALKEPEKPPGKGPISLPKEPTGEEVCPVCGNHFRFVDGGAVRVVDGKVDMENVKPKYECDTCGVFYREVLSSGFYLPYPQQDEDRVAQPSSAETSDDPEGKQEESAAAGRGPIALPKEPKGNETCPVCGKRFRFVEGGAVRVVDGKLDMENIKPKYECDTCGVFYREVLTSGFYLPYPQQDEDRIDGQAEPEPAKVLATGDLAPMMLKCDENNQCQCPRCGAMMDYVEGQAVHLVDGKPDMENVWDHFNCNTCHSVFRRIVNTDYFQFSEK